jgi:hypothetical protein
MLRAVKLRKTVRLHVCCTLINSIEPAGHYACIQNSHNNKHFLIAELSEEDRKYIIGNPNGYWGADCASN